MTFERAVKRNPDNELPLIYLASSFGHLGRIKDADDAIEAVNDLRAQAGLGDLSLGTKSNSYISPFQGEIDFTRIGGRPAQERVRAGLTDIPALKWHYLVTPHSVPGPTNDWWEVEGATRIDAATAKSLYDRGVVFINVSGVGWWKEGHIPGTVHLSWPRPSDPAKERLKESTLLNLVAKTDEFVLYGSIIDSNSPSAAFASAKALTWGFTRVYYLGGELRAWNKAGYPVETGQ
jgi:rhodanese-related sulfurtransferase